MSVLKDLFLEDIKGHLVLMVRCCVKKWNIFNNPAAGCSVF